MSRQFNRAEDEIIIRHFVSDGVEFVLQRIRPIWAKSRGRESVTARAVLLGVIERDRDRLEFRIKNDGGLWPKLPRVAA